MAIIDRSMLNLVENAIACSGAYSGVRMSGHTLYAISHNASKKGDLGWQTKLGWRSRAVITRSSAP